MTEARERHAQEGTIWVCGACGRTNKDRYSMGDTSCVTWAVLCHEERDADGQWRAFDSEAPDHG